MPNLGDLCRSINLDKDPDLIDDYNQADYVPYIINRMYSLYPDTVMIANEMNTFSQLPKQMQYKYYVYSVRKKRRFSPWLKYQIPEDVALIKKYFRISTKKAREMVSLLSPEDIDNIKESLESEGGTKND